MRVLIPTLTRPHLGGAHTLLAATGKGLARRGHQVVHVSLFGVGSEPALALTTVRASDRFLSGRAARPRDAVTIATYLAARTALAARLAWMAARTRFDVVFTVDAGATRALAGVPFLAGTGVVFDVAGRLQLDLEGQGKIRVGAGGSRWFRREEARAYRDADVVFAYPPSFAAQVEIVAPRAHIVTASTAILDVDRIRPLDAQASQRARRAFDLPLAAFVVLVPSRLVARKGVVEAVDIVARARAAGLDQVVLVFAGEGPESERVLARARAHGLVDHLRLLGGVDPARMGEVYGAADVVLLPAMPALGYEEPQGLSTFEALAAERPVVASRLGGIPEVIRDGVTGLLAAPGDIDAFAHHLVQVARDPQLAATLVRGGRAELESRLANDAHFVLLEGLLDEARARRGLRGRRRFPGRSPGR